MSANPYVDGITNIAIPDCETGVSMENHILRGSLYGIESKMGKSTVSLNYMQVGGNIILSNMKAGIVEMTGMYVKEDATLNGLMADLISLDKATIKEGLYCNDLNVNRFVDFKNLEAELIQGGNIKANDVILNSLLVSEYADFRYLKASTGDFSNLRSVCGTIDFNNMKINYANFRGAKSNVDLDLSEAAIDTIEIDNLKVNRILNLNGTTINKVVCHNPIDVEEYAINDKTKIPQEMLDLLKRYSKLTESKF